MGEIVDRKNILTISKAYKETGHRFVTTCGCFDILHIGHKRFLEACAAQGDVLVVLVNSDRSVRALKGAGRPCVPEEERAEILSAFSCVDYVCIYDEDTPDEILKIIDPDVHCKGNEYKLEDVGERHVVRHVELIPIDKLNSTTKIINQILVNNGTIDVEQLRNSPDVVVDDNHDWGFELRLINNDLYTGKFLVYTNNTHAGSCHYHAKKTETFKIISGEVLVYKEPNVQRIFKHGEEILIPREYRHQMRAVTPRAVIMEVSTHHDDSDTYRVESIL